jgi:bifunctional DNA-binding transcriptional regulator/antitoxin component of YhaV-PrlF toxin-antitoxin module
MSATKQIQASEPVVTSLTVNADGGLTIPAEVLELRGIEPGDTIEVEIGLLGVVLVPVVTDEEMAAHWGPRWREELDAAEADVAAGRSTFHASTEEFLAALKARTHADS